MTDTVILREVFDSDLPHFFAHQQQAEALHMAAFLSRDPADHGVFLAHWAMLRQEPKVTVRTIVWAGQVAGYVTKFERHDKPEVAYWLGRDFWGQGLATQALTALLALVPTRPLYAGVVKDNVASLRVLQKCGFHIIGEAKDFSQVRGQEVEEYLLMLDQSPAR